MIHAATGDAIYLRRCQTVEAGIKVNTSSLTALMSHIACCCTIEDLLSTPTKKLCDILLTRSAVA